MPRADRLKEEIGWLKVAFGIAVALDASLIAWIVQNYENASPVRLVAAGVAALIVSVLIAMINRRAYRRLEELEAE
ncbi:MAG: hypothetical protein ACT4P5_06635 [Armatimonadota bacterium]